MDEMMPEEVVAVRGTMNRFMQTEVNPVRYTIERSGEFTRVLVEKAGAAGLHGCATRARTTSPTNSRWRTLRLRDEPDANEHE